VSPPSPTSKVGFSAELAGWAAQDGELYGLSAIALALLAGWFGGAVMRRI
jgi:Putative transmembrane protein (Alph_Pro_TM)